MCYSGRCKYEHYYTGECVNSFDKVPFDGYCVDKEYIFNEYNKLEDNIGFLIIKSKYISLLNKKYKSDYRIKANLLNIYYELGNYKEIVEYDK